MPHEILGISEEELKALSAERTSRDEKKAILSTKLEPVRTALQLLENPESATTYANCVEVLTILLQNK